MTVPFDPSLAIDPAVRAEFEAFLAAKRASEPIEVAAASEDNPRFWLIADLGSEVAGLVKVWDSQRGRESQGTIVAADDRGSIVMLSGVPVYARAIVDATNLTKAEQVKWMR